MDVTSFGAEKHKLSRTLVSFLVAFVDKEVKVELQNDTLVSGVLERVDPGMNVYLLNARVWRQNHLQHPTQLQFEHPDDCKQCKSYFVHGSKIRYIHMEPVEDPLKVAENTVARIMSSRGRPRRMMNQRWVKNEEDRLFASSVKERRMQYSGRGR